MDIEEKKGMTKDKDRLKQEREGKDDEGGEGWEEGSHILGTHYSKFCRLNGPYITNHPLIQYPTYTEFNRVHSILVTEFYIYLNTLLHY